MPTQKTYTVYKFDELPEESQTKAIKKWRENIDNFPFLTDQLEEKLSELLELNGITVGSNTPKIYYSLNYCQGDGAMFELINAIWDKAKKYNINVKQSGHYYNYNSKNIDIEDDNGNSAPDKVYEAFDKVYIKICKELEKTGYDEIEYQNSDEVIAETLRINEYDLTIDGNID